MNTAATDYYQVLGIDRDADFRLLKRAYYRRAKECHPDLFGNDRAKEEQFKVLVQAFDVLSDPVRRREYDAHLPDPAMPGAAPVTGPDLFVEDDADAIMDSRVDDTLEELIVGNSIPRGTTLRTLMLDLERTERFCVFREALNDYGSGSFRKAHLLFGRAVAGSPCNILYRYYLAQTHARLGHTEDAVRHLQEALRLGLVRQPPLRLNRFRRQIEALQRRRGGLLIGLRSLLFGAAEPPLASEDADSMRRAVGRSMNRLNALSRARERRQLQGGSARRKTP